MYNYYDRLKQKERLLSTPSQITDEYKEDMAEIAEEINEDFVEAIIDKIMLEGLPKKIEEEINSSRSLEDLKKVEIRFKIQNIGRPSSLDKHKIYNHTCYPRNYFADNNTKHITGLSQDFYADQVLSDLFGRQLLDRFSVYTNTNTENKSGIQIEHHEDEFVRFVTRINITGSVSDFIRIYYTELQGYNHKRRVKDTESYDDTEYKNLSRILIYH